MPISSLLRCRLLLLLSLQLFDGGARPRFFCCCFLFPEEEDDDGLSCAPMVPCLLLLLLLTLLLHVRITKAQSPQRACSGLLGEK